MRVRRKIAVLNRSSEVEDAELEQINHSLQHELDSAFAKVWGTGAILNLVPRGSDEGWQNKWNLVVVDNMEEAGALGYHDLTPDGLPVGYVGAKTVAEYDDTLSVTISHEIFEMLGDPEINLAADDGAGRLCWYENCDPVEADDLAYTVFDVPISNYVYPTWFVPSLASRTMKFDRMGYTSRPFMLCRGGYQGYTTSWPPNWQQEFAETEGPMAMHDARPKFLSRRMRRITPRDQWIRSAP